MYGGPIQPFATQYAGYSIPVHRSLMQGQDIMLDISAKTRQATCMFPLVSYKSQSFNSLNFATKSKPQNRVASLRPTFTLAPAFFNLGINYKGQLSSKISCNLQLIFDDNFAKIYSRPLIHDLSISYHICMGKVEL